MLNTRKRELFTVRVRVLFGARRADEVLAEVTAEHWWINLLCNDQQWKTAEAPPRLVMNEKYNNLFAYMGDGDDPDRIYASFGFTSLNQLYLGGFQPEGCFERIHEAEELKAAWLAECQWRNQGKPRRKIKTVLEEVLAN